MSTINSFLKIMFWNAQGISTESKRAQFHHILEQQNIDIVLLAETFLNEHHEFNMPGFNIYRNDRDSHAGGVAIIIKKNIAHKQCSVYKTSKMENISISVKISGRDTILTSAYSPKYTASFEKDLRIISPRNSPFIIMGDLNAHHSSWNCARNNAAGRVVYDLQNRSHFFVHNTTTPTHFPHCGTTPSTIDLLLTNSNLSIPQMHTLENVLLSDHTPVIISFQANTERQPPAMIPDYKRANWMKYQQIINSNIDLETNLNSTNSIEKAIEDLVALIKLAKNESVPVTKKRDPVQNISHSAKMMIQHRNSLLRQKQRTHCPIYKALLKTMINKCNKDIDQHIQKDRNKNWQSTLSNLPTGAKKFWSLNKNLRGKNSGVASSLLDGTSKLITAEEKAQTIADKFEIAHQSLPSYSHPINEKVNRFINTMNSKNCTSHILTTQEEISRIITKLRPFKAAGPDGIQNILIKKLPPKAVKLIATIFNHCILKGYWPSAFKHAKVIPIPKSGKDTTKPENYRPISLLNVIGKILEKLFQSRISNFAEANNILNPTQFGFRSEHSSTHQVKRLTDFITGKKSMRKSTGLITLDIEKAFDAVWHDGLIYKLNKFGFPFYIVKLVNSFIRSRSFAVHIHESKSSSRPIPAGLAQGSALSPILYAIYTSDIKIPKETETAFFADDTGLYTAAKSSNTIVRRLQKALDKIQIYFRKWRIKINGGKTQAILFPYNNQRRRIPTARLKMQDVPIKFVKTTKYLGITLDNKLNFAAHVNITCDKATKCHRALYPLISQGSQLSVDNKKLIYKSIILPIITFGSPVWHRVAPTHMGKLQLIQNRCLKGIYRLPRRFSTDRLHSVYGHPTIRQSINTIASNFSSKCQQSGHDLIRALSE